MRLRPNERLVKEYNKYYLIEVECPNNAKYRTTIHKNDSDNMEKRERVTGPYNLKG